MTAGIKYFEEFYQQASQDAELLEKNANDYPYSSLAGFLLLYHYQKTNHPGFEKLAKKTALHFKNANWLQFLLSRLENENLQAPAADLKYVEEDKKDANEAQSLEEVTQIVYDEKPVQLVEEAVENDHLEIIEVPQVADTRHGPFSQILQEPDVKNGSSENIQTQETPEEIPFEPLHTVDYFASQGIKITEEPVTLDKLGNQMKSFTAWLKSMKKLHPLKLEEQDIATEKLIQNSAEVSNIDAEVLTEAMAEVLIKQDKKEKAVEMYHKLSLINPSKSAYFAAKIESIKSS